MTDAAVLGHAPRLEDCAGDDVHPPADPAAAPPSIQKRRGTAPTRAAENSGVPQALSTSEDPPAVANRRGGDYEVNASRAVRLPEGEHPLVVNVQRGVDNDVDASHAVHLQGGGASARRDGPACRGVRSRCLRLRAPAGGASLAGSSTG